MGSLNFPKLVMAYYWYKYRPMTGHASTDARLTHHADVVPLRSQNPALQAAKQTPTLEQEDVAASRRLLERKKSLHLSQLAPTLLVLLVVLLSLLLRRICAFRLTISISISILGPVATLPSPLAPATPNDDPCVSWRPASGSCCRCCPRCWRCFPTVAGAVAHLGGRRCCFRCLHRCYCRFRSRRGPSFSFSAHFVVEQPTVCPSTTGSGRCRCRRRRR